MTYVTILAQGAQTRLPDLAVPKQLLSLRDCGNQPILGRTLWQLRELGAKEVRVVCDGAVRDFVLTDPARDGAAKVDTLQEPGNSSLKGLARHQPTWELRPLTVVLLGDVVYSWKCLQAAMSHEPPQYPGFAFAGTSDLSGSRGELWWVRWERRYHDMMLTTMTSALKVHPPFDEYQPGQMRLWLWEVNRYFHIATGSPHPFCQPPPWYFPIDDYTKDFDTPQDLVALDQVSTRARHDDDRHGLLW